MSTPEIHVKCRNQPYVDKLKNIERFHVPDDKVDWKVTWDKYSPPEYTSERVIGREWADPDIREETFYPLWNSEDGNVNRVSYTGEYEIDACYPLNPFGRTGLKGRGLLGRWGPNHAVDAIVTRWQKIDGQIQNSTETHKPVLQFISIKRRVGGEWALPGGMIDAGETTDQALVREFLEETLNINDRNEDEKFNLQKSVENFFKNGTIVYAGYVDDPRNTDNAWMETTVFHIHEEDYSCMESLPLQAGDDAECVQWMDIDKTLKLYANHCTFIKKVIDRKNAHW